NRTDTEGASSLRNKEDECSNLHVQQLTPGVVPFVYPNTSRGRTKEYLGDIYNNVHLKVVDDVGKTVLEQSFSNIQNIEVNTSNYTKGLYLIQLQALNQNATFKLIVE